MALLPKYHQERCIVKLSDLKVQRGTRKVCRRTAGQNKPKQELFWKLQTPKIANPVLVLTRWPFLWQKAKHFVFSANGAFDEVVDGIRTQHGKGGSG